MEIATRKHFMFTRETLQSKGLCYVRISSIPYYNFTFTLEPFGKV